MKKSRFGIAIQWNRFGFRSQALESIMEKLIAGKWDEMAQEHGITRR